MIGSNWSFFDIFVKFVLLSLRIWLLNWFLEVSTNSLHPTIMNHYLIVIAHIQLCRYGKNKHLT